MTAPVTAVRIASGRHWRRASGLRGAYGCLLLLSACSSGPAAPEASTPAASDNTSASASACPSSGATDLIVVSTPEPGALVESPVTVAGKARGNWYFEADFPVTLHDDHDALLATGIARAQGEWMTEAFVPFRLQLAFTRGQARSGRIVLHRNNPSDLREQDAELCIPVRFSRQ